MLSKFFTFIIKSALFLITILSFFAFILILFYSKDLPDIKTLSEYHPPLTTRVYSVDGKLIQQYAKENRIFVPISSIPDSVVKAFIAAEDKNYYNHSGIDFNGILRAALLNVKNIAANKRLEGGSTITQQVTKNFLLSNERSISRKVKEAVLSFIISNKLSKDHILELYLNQAYLGRRAYGVAAASLAYFDKSIDALTLAEAAFIAGLPKAPSKFDPLKNYDRAKLRRDYVIRRMLEDGYISDEEAEDAIAMPIILRKKNKYTYVEANFFAEKVRQIMVDLYGEEEFYTGGYTVITTIDSHMQSEANKAFINGVKNYDQSKGFNRPIAKIDVTDWQIKLNSIQEQAGQKDYKLSVILSIKDNEMEVGFKNGQKGLVPFKYAAWAKREMKSLNEVFHVGDVILVKKLNDKYMLGQIPDVNGGMVVKDIHNGSIKAYIGGYDYWSNKYDRVTQAERQPGSAIKPIVYLAALEYGVTPNSLFNDGEIELDQGSHLDKWKPKNHSEDFWGYITLRLALEKSRNLVTVRVAKHIGIEKVSEMISRLGINASPPPFYSMVLGSLETTLDKMTTAYAIVGNGGYKVYPKYIELIQDKNGKILYKRDDTICENCSLPEEDDYTLPSLYESEKEYILDPASAYQLTSILKGGAKRGTSRRLAHHNLPIAAKTGTTNKSFDVWQIAYTPEYSMGTYLGFDSPRTLGEHAYGANVALPIIDKYLDYISEILDRNDFDIPNNVEFEYVDLKNGELSNNSSAITEVFKVGDTKIPEKYEDDYDIQRHEFFSEEFDPDQQNQFFIDIKEAN